jgi:hypothetical protein
VMLSDTDRVLVRYYFEDNASVHIILQGTIDTLEAIEMAEEMLRVKRVEIDKRRASNAPEEKP